MSGLDAVIKKAKTKIDAAKAELSDNPFFQEYLKQSLLLEALLEEVEEAPPSPSIRSVRPRPARNTANMAASHQLDFTGKETIDVSELGVAERESSNFTSVVESAIQKFNDQEFMVSHVEKLLEGMGVEIGSKTPRAKIAGVLSKAVAKGLIEKTHSGTGNEPHRYKLVSNDDPLV